MGGVYSLCGRGRGRPCSCGCLPALLDNWGVSTELLTILFGVGVLQVLLTAPGGIVEQFPKDMAKLGPQDRRAVPGRSHEAEPPP